MKSIVSLPSSDLALSFSGCGFLASYHFGVAICFRKHAKNLLSRTRYFCGSSAGALVGAMLLLSPNTLEDGLSQLVLLANEINSYKLGALSPGVNLSERLLSIIEQNIPSDISVAQDRLLLSLTRTRDYSNTIISKFENRQHLIECLNATCFVPVYSDVFSKPPVIQGETFIDGACTNNLPTVRNVPTVTVSPFSGSALITPEDNNLFDWKMCISNQIMNVNMQNVVRGAQALFPPSEEKLMDYYGAGFRDAMRFLLEKRWFEREFGTEV